MECAVCYGEAGPFQKLCCGHTFCSGCVKNWYLKGVAGTSCPMCRAPIYFKGFHKLRDQWNEDAWETKCSEIFGQAIDECFEEACEFAESMPLKWRGRVFNDVIEDFIDIEKTYRFLKNEGIDPADMEDVFVYGDYYSDRHMNKYMYNDEPVKNHASRYPKSTRGGGRCGKRARARQDAWATFTLMIDF